jgi:hypothetical protein
VHVNTTKCAWVSSSTSHHITHLYAQSYLRHHLNHLELYEASSRRRPAANALQTHAAHCLHTCQVHVVARVSAAVAYNCAARSTQHHYSEAILE